jgi:hypothetical protein
MDRYGRQRRLSEIGEAGQAKLLGAHAHVAGGDGALTELVYLHRAGLSAVTMDALAVPRPFAHAAQFRHAAARRHAAGAWRALRTIGELVGRASS